MDNEPLVKAIAAVMIFLEESESAESDPDAAARCMESIVHELLGFVDSDRAEFIDLVDRVAMQTSNEHDARFIRGIPRMVELWERYWSLVICRYGCGKAC